eukprot:gnl/TRDRNA2_/TRDRNA2_71353_c0_seq1.p2 gnl/TRDRNA2_/TRDRNA2_71353_c0~~gnl/TRDRNA2_/TRDRNA2_71353_c0_seq1.p2  ORF type:complete len:108 (+),score=14.49 gnl/TRDRNA2_/TRDRNA2_71353_c0_seq1:234-557(+)
MTPKLKRPAQFDTDMIVTKMSLILGSPPRDKFIWAMLLIIVNPEPPVIITHVKISHKSKPRNASSAVMSLEAASASAATNVSRTLFDVGPTSSTLDGMEGLSFREAI